jgi:hypothetical protein
MLLQMIQMALPLLLLLMPLVLDTQMATKLLLQSLAQVLDYN